jgi:arginine-tRNA-protein transferase
MRCRDCSACVPIRIHPGEFRPNRNQRRAVKKNSDIEVTLLPLSVDEENLDLCERFLQVRYPKENNSGRGYYRDFFLNNIVSTLQMQFRLQGRLVGTSILDVGADWLNGVYFYFDPDESKRSLGTFNIIKLIEICQRWDISYFYLGYFIRNISAMSYKEKFNPRYLLLNRKWERNER